MNITEEKTGDLTANLKIEVKESDYSEQYKNELKKYRKQASMPGFRPGKVPMSIIRKKFGNTILAEEINKLVSQKLNNYIIENKLDLLGHPIADMDKEPPDFRHEQDFDFFFDIAYAPEINIDLSEENEVDYYEIKVDEKVINNFIEETRKRHGEQKEVEEVDDDCMLEVKLTELDDEGNPKENGINNQTSLLPRYIKDEKVRNELLGSIREDKLTFNPLKATENATETASMLGIEKDEAENLESDFEVEIIRITRQEPAEMNADLYEKAFPGSNIENEEAFRNRIAEEAEKAYAAESDKFFARQVMDKLMEDADIKLPDEFLKRWIYVSNDGKISMADIESDYPKYEQSMKFQLLENKLLKENEELIVKDQDIKDEIKKYLKNYMPAPDEDEDGQHEKQLDALAENFLQNKEETKRIHDQLFEQRLSSFLKSKLKLNKQKISYDDFVNKIQDLHAHDHEHDHDHGEESENDNI